MDALFGILFAVFFITILVGIPISRQFNQYLKSNHPSLWKDIGPNTYMDQSMRTQINRIMFVFKRKDKEIGDLKLSVLTKKLYLWNLINLIFFLGMIVLFAMLVINSHSRY